jgi:CRISP-associated protein Cas1
LLPQDEYRPPNHAQQWFALWSDEATRLEMGRELLLYRLNWTRQMWHKLDIDVDEDIFIDFEHRLMACQKNADLLSAEALYAKSLYRTLAVQFKLGQFVRDAGKAQRDTTEQRINSFLDHGNYLAYGYAAVALHGMGVPYFLPVLHGKTRRGALVFDIADLFKDWLVMPTAFEAGKKKQEDQVFRARVIESALAHDVLDTCMTFISELPSKINKKQGVTKSLSP